MRPNVGDRSFAHDAAFVQQQDPERFRRLLAMEQHEVARRYSVYEQLAKLSFGNGQSGTARPTDK